MTNRIGTGREMYGTTWKSTNAPPTYENIMPNSRKRYVVEFNFPRMLNYVVRNGKIRESVTLISTTKIH